MHGEDQQEPSLLGRDPLQSLPQGGAARQQALEVVGRRAVPARGVEIEDPTLERQFERFEDDQRRALGGGPELGRERAGPRLVGQGGERRHQGADLRHGERLEDQVLGRGGVDRAIDAGPRGRDHEHGVAAEPPQQRGGELARLRIHPVHVVEQERERRFVGDRRKQLGQREHTAAHQLVAGGAVGLGGRVMRREGRRESHQRAGGRRRYGGGAPLRGASAATRSAATA